MLHINFFAARARLVAAWLIMGTVLSGCFAFLLTGPIFDGRHSEALGWFIPNLFPILTVVISGFFGDIEKNDSFKVEVPKSYFYVALYLSIAYMSFFAFVLYMYTPAKGNIVDYYNNWNLLLGSVQALAIAGVTAFFGKKKRSDSNPGQS